MGGGIGLGLGRFTDARAGQVARDMCDLQPFRCSAEAGTAMAMAMAMAITHHPPLLIPMGQPQLQPQLQPSRAPPPPHPA